MTGSRGQLGIREAVEFHGPGAEAGGETRSSQEVGVSGQQGQGDGDQVSQHNPGVMPGNLGQREAVEAGGGP